jgi:hypothetical protein
VAADAKTGTTHREENGIDFQLSSARGNGPQQKFRQLAANLSFANLSS